MATSIQISKQSTIPLPNLQSFKLVVKAINPINMPSKVFIKQRIRNFAKDSFDDTFVAICTPVQLEDLAEDSPEDGTSYYRTDTIELIVRTAEMLQVVFDSLLYEVQKLVLDLQNMQQLEHEEVFMLSSDGPENPSSPIITDVYTNASQQLVIRFNRPINLANSSISAYEYSLDGGETWVTSFSAVETFEIVVSNTVLNQLYYITVRALTSSGKYGLPATIVEYTRTGVVGSIFTGTSDYNWTNISNWLSTTRVTATEFPSDTTSVVLEQNCIVDVDDQNWQQPANITIASHNITFNSTALVRPVITCDITATTGTVVFNGVDYGVQ